jgi:tetratricopeptide (TPR) repeat protein/tRNA A-37 threonylcarbamoyl transferase component Bud32
MNEDRLKNLLSDWREHHLQGRDLTAAELCRDCPELVAELSQRIAVLRQNNAPVQKGEPPPGSAAWETLHVGDAGNLAASEDRTTPEESRDFGTPGRALSSPLPKSVSGYEILRELGRGGMGVVYQARQRGINRIVALKMILAGSHAGPEALARFLREAETVGRLKHPNVVQVYECGSHEDKPYFSQEYVEGGSLANKLRGEPQPPEQAARLVQALAEAVHAAHEQGIVHRDLKPANVLLTADGTPKVTDFGLAKQGDSGVTATGDVLGSPSYMAPEQAAGDVRKIGPAADIYALGVILYELLTGRPPFKGASAWDTVQMVTGSEPVPPSQLQPKLPRDLETICLKCLQKEPGRRYASARALAADLGHFLAKEPIEARAVRLPERFWRWCLRKPAVAGLLGGLALALLAGFAGVTAFWLRAERHRHQALENLAEAERQRDQAIRGFREARDAVDRFYTAVSQNELLDKPGMAPLRKRLLENARAFYQAFVQEHADDVKLRQELADAMMRLASITKDVASDTEALQVFQEATGIYQELLHVDTENATAKRNLAAAWSQIGLLLIKEDRYPETEHAFQEEARLWEELASQYPKNLDFKSGQATACSHLGLIYRRTRRLAQAETALLRGAALWKELLAEQEGNEEYESFFSWCLLHLGYVYNAKGERGKAQEAYQQMLALRRSLVDRHPQHLGYRLDLSKGFSVIGGFYEDDEPARAEAFYREALAFDEKLAQENPGVAFFTLSLGDDYTSLASLVSTQGKRKDALQWCIQAIKILDELLKREPTHVEAKKALADALAQRANVLDDLDRPKDAILDWDRALSLNIGRYATRFRVMRAVCRAHAGEFGKAIADVDALTASAKPSGSLYYNSACVYALAAAAAISTDTRLAEQHATRAVQFLTRARSERNFAEAANAKLLRTDKDLAALRSRADFKKLVAEIEAETKPVGK